MNVSPELISKEGGDDMIKWLRITNDENGLQWKDKCN